MASKLLTIPAQTTAPKVLVTRPKPQGLALCQALADAGITSAYVPALIIAANHYDFPQQPAQMLDQLIILSSNAIQYCSELYPANTQQLPIIAIGPATQQALISQRDYDLEQIILPQVYSSEGLLQLDCLQTITGQTIGLLCGIGGRALLEQVLAQRGANCLRIETYQRLFPADYSQALQQCLALNSIEQVVVTSGEALTNLVAMAAEQLPKLLALNLIVMSNRIADIAKELGFTQPALVFPHADNRVIVDLLRSKQG